jgi:hypothetical protein
VYQTNLRGLCDEAQRPRESVLQRIAAIDCCDAADPAVERVVGERIAELMFAPDAEVFRDRLGNQCGEDKVMSLLVRDCAHAAAAAAPKRKERRRPYYRGKAFARRPDLRVVTTH